MTNKVKDKKSVLSKKQYSKISNNINTIISDGNLNFDADDSTICKKNIAEFSILSLQNNNDYKSNYRKKSK